MRNLALGGHAIEGAIRMRAEVRRHAEIPRRRLGRSELEVSALALGSWQTFARIDRQPRIAVMRGARERGITFLDDARYHDAQGRSEILFRRAVPGGRLTPGRGRRREQAVVGVLAGPERPELAARADRRGRAARGAL
jgi:aryl-alcohol dehydrogenase-like predicted oxidoreductase